MAATAEQRKLTEVLLDELCETSFPSATQLDRIERLISTRDELETYMAVLMSRVEGKISPDPGLLDRIERLVGLLRQVDQQAGKGRS